MSDDASTIAPSSEPMDINDEPLQPFAAAETHPRNDSSFSPLPPPRKKHPMNLSAICTPSLPPIRLDSDDVMRKARQLQLQPAPASRKTLFAVQNSLHALHDAHQTSEKRLLTNASGDAQASKQRRRNANRRPALRPKREEELMREIIALRWALVRDKCPLNTAETITPQVEKDTVTVARDSPGVRSVLATRAARAWSVSACDFLPKEMYYMLDKNDRNPFLAMVDNIYAFLKEEMNAGPPQHDWKSTIDYLVSKGILLVVDIALAASTSTASPNSTIFEEVAARNVDSIRLLFDLLAKAPFKVDLGWCKVIAAAVIQPLAKKAKSCQVTFYDDLCGACIDAVTEASSALGTLPRRNSQVSGEIFARSVEISMAVATYLPEVVEKLSRAVVQKIGAKIPLFLQCIPVTDGSFTMQL